jgi:hypothetical protein
MEKVIFPSIAPSSCREGSVSSIVFVSFELACRNPSYKINSQRRFEWQGMIAVHHTTTMCDSR